MYWLVSPFSSKNNGISNYCDLACELLNENGVEAKIIKNPDSLNVKNFESLVLDTVSSGDVVEIPDAWGLLATSSKQGVLHHTRLHAPSKLLQEINGAKINAVRFDREVQAALNAHVISSPSSENVSAYGVFDDERDIFVYPNPCVSTVQPKVEKKYDYVFIGRADFVKGFDYLIELAYLMPPDRKLLVMGATQEQFHSLSRLPVAANIEFCGWVSNEQKRKYLDLSKVCLMPSRFESFSLVCAEAISHHCEVVAWNVGGLSECFPGNLVTLVEPFDTLSFIAAAEEALLRSSDNELDRSNFLSHSNACFVSSVKKIIQSERPSHVVPQLNKTYYPNFLHKQKVEGEVVKRFFEVSSPKVFGFSMMNEHAEQMWGALNPFVKDYRYVSRKPLGYNDKFGHNFPIDDSKFFVDEWRFDQARLLDLFKSFDPDLLFVFNGNTGHFKLASEKLLQEKQVGVVYSELGWMPQRGNIYFDRRGANAESLLAQQSFEALLGSEGAVDNLVTVNTDSNICLLILQLPGDTTLDPAYFPLCLSNSDLVSHVRDAVPDNYQVIVRPHPRDVEKYSFDALDNVVVDNDTCLEKQLRNAHSVVVVNSTVVLEAFHYDVEIYTLGYGVFSNKGLTIDCSDGRLSEKWASNVAIRKDRRIEFLNYLEKRQLNVKALYECCDLNDFGTALFPIVSAYLYNGRVVENRAAIVNSEADGMSEKISETKITHKKKKGSGKLARKRKLLNLLVKRKKSLPVNFFLRSPFAASYFSELFPMTSVSKRKLGKELDKDFSSIKNYQFIFPNKAFAYHKVKWIYFGVDKALVRYCNSTLVSRLDYGKKLDVCAMLAEAGHETKAVQLAKSILKKKPSLMRSRQYLRIASLVSREDDFMAKLPADEKKHIQDMAACFSRIEEDKPKLWRLISQNKRSFHVVGNSPVSRGCKKGKMINASGLVFRFNNYDVSLDKRADIGVKTDVWVKSPSFDEVARKDVSGFKAVVLTGTNHVDRSPSAYDFFKPFLSRDDLVVGMVPHDIYSKLCLATKAPPSGGIQMLTWLKEVSGKIEESKISGFSLTEIDATKSPEGKVGDKSKYLHDWGVEVGIIRSYLR